MGEVPFILEKVNQILNNTKFLQCIRTIKELEVTRIFCHHGIDHLLNTARIGYIRILENNLPIAKEEIYGAALLHDIGKWKEYVDKIPHEKASAMLAVHILQECGYADNQIKRIIEAIKNHRNKNAIKDSLSELLYYSDKKSRNCFCCKGQQQCNWPLEKKNIEIQY